MDLCIAICYFVPYTLRIATSGRSLYCVLHDDILDFSKIGDDLLMGVLNARIANR